MMAPVNVSFGAHLQDDVDTIWSRTVLPLTIFTGVVCVSGLIGNIFVLYIHVFRYKKCNFRWFVIGLCLTNILACSTAVPLQMHLQQTLFRQMSPPLCKAETYLNVFTSIELVVFLFCICLDRYRKLLTPHGWQINGKHIMLICVGTSLIGLLESTPITIIWDNVDVLVRHENITTSAKMCGMSPSYKSNFSFAIALAVLMPNYILVCASLVMYGFIFQRLKNFRKAYQQKESDKPIGPSAGKDKCHLSKKQIDCILQNSLYADNRRLHDSQNSISTAHRSGGETNVPNRKSTKTKLPSVIMTSLSTFTFNVVLLVTAILYMVLSFYLMQLQKRHIDVEDFSRLVAVLFGQRLYFLNYVMHPFLFGLLDPNFRRKPGS